MASDNSTSPRLCIPGGTGPEYATHTCNTTNVLTSLAVFNAVALAIALITGHEAFRRKIPSLIKSQGFSPWGGLAMCFTQVMIALAATAISRSKGYESSFKGVFALWMLRPRISLAIAPFAVYSTDFWDGKSHPFLMTTMDVIFFETFMNIFCIPFALGLKGDLPLQTCSRDHLRLMGIRVITFNVLRSSLNFAIFAGVVSCFLVAGFCILWLSKSSPASNRPFQLGAAWYVLTLSMFASNWVFWGSFIKLSQGAYCPAAIAGTGAAWGVGFIINGFLRPLFGNSL